MIDKTIKLRHGFKLYVHESNEPDPIGVIIDLYKNDEFCDSYTIHYDDFADDEVNN